MRSSTDGWFLGLFSLTLVLACAYVAAYVMLVEPRIGVGKDSNGVNWHERHPDYRLGDETTALIFAPLATIDGLLRPDYWRAWQESSEAVP
jgi:hypothetical protein